MMVIYNAIDCTVPVAAAVDEAVVADDVASVDDNDVDDVTVIVFVCNENDVDNNKCFLENY